MLRYIVENAHFIHIGIPGKYIHGFKACMEEAKSCTVKVCSTLFCFIANAYKIFTSTLFFRILNAKRILKPKFFAN